jgi:hypothetical protein
MASPIIQILETEKHPIDLIHYKISYNQRHYTFSDYIYSESGLPVAGGELATLKDNAGNLINDSAMLDCIGEFVDNFS